MAINLITGGAFADSSGNPVANGSMTLRLNVDANIASGGQVCAGITTTVPLDASGNVSGSVSVWPNDQLVPINTNLTSYYIVNVYTALGQLVYGPQFQQVLSSPSPFNIGVWVPTV